VAKKSNWEIVIAKPVEKVYDKSGKDMKERLKKMIVEIIAILPRGDVY
jgi:hypothetical protein